MFDAFDFPDIGDILSWKLILIVILISILRQYLKGAQFNGDAKLKGKYVVVTGCDVGIGKQLARELNYRGATVIMGCRDVKKGEEALAELVKVGCNPGRLILLILDLADFKSVRKFVEDLRKRTSQIDILINNAAVMMFPTFKLTEDRHELHWQTNYLGHFLLTELLLPFLKSSSDEAKIVNVSATAHFAATLDLSVVDTKEGYEPREAYSRSKLALIMHARHLGRILRKDGFNVVINACNPGLAYTRLFRHTPLQNNKVLRYTLGPIAWFLLKTPKDGAQTILHCAISKDVAGVSGKYFSECKEVPPSEAAMDEKRNEQLYMYSLDAVGLK